jgi:thiamine pyrophosphate-dependent acetolactate synthase large subunit-like protein
MTGEPTVRSVTFDLLRSLGLTTVFGNPGSTEQTFLQEFPADFTYVLALQEASAIAMADAFAQVTRRPAVVNLHSSAGLGNAMGNLVAAYHGNTPLIVTAGQQHRELVIGEPYLGNREATTMPKPWVKWSYEPARAQDVPEAFMRAYAMALQPQQVEWLPTVRTGSFFATSSGGIGWGVPAAVGVALGDRDRGVTRPVIALIGDGSFQYSVQALWTAAQRGLPVVYVVMRNSEYSILKSFALLEDTPGVPGLDLPGLDIAAVARGFGCRAVDVATTGDLEREFKAALSAGTPTVIVVPTQPQQAML